MSSLTSSGKLRITSLLSPSHRIGFVGLATAFPTNPAPVLTGTSLGQIWHSSKGAISAAKSRALRDPPGVLQGALVSIFFLLFFS